MHTSYFYSSSIRLLVILYLFFVVNLNVSNNNKGQVLAINLTEVEIDNDLPSSSALALGDIPELKVEIKKGKSYAFIARGGYNQWIEILLKSEKLCIVFLMYNPKEDYKLRHITFSLRQDGIYRRDDQNNWSFYLYWQSIEDCKVSKYY